MGSPPTEFMLFKNSGIAFSIPMIQAVFWPFALLILGSLIFLFFRTRKSDPVTAALLFAIIAGAVSNLVDRVLIGATIDYLILFDRSAVNIADIMILASVIALFFVLRNIEKS